MKRIELTTDWRVGLFYFWLGFMVGIIVSDLTSPPQHAEVTWTPGLGHQPETLLPPE